MKLSISEEQNFHKIYTKLLSKTSGNFNKSFILKLLTTRAHIPEPIALQVKYSIYKEFSIYIYLS